MDDAAHRLGGVGTDGHDEATVSLGDELVADERLGIRSADHALQHAAQPRANPRDTASDPFELDTGVIYTLDAPDNFADGFNGLPPITSELTINGNGSTIQRNAASEFRIIHVGSSGDLTLNDGTVRGGASGARNGGGIFNGGTLTVTNSTISANSTSNDSGDRGGGGIFNTGALLITNSIVSGNTATRFGGGIDKS